MQLLDSISQPGALNNEDFVRYRDGAYALVLDGASGLSPNVLAPHLQGRYATDAQWLVATFATSFDARWDAPIPLPKVVDACLGELKAAYDALPLSPEERDCSPSASLSLFRANGEGGELFLLGDCTAVLSGPEEPQALRDPAVSRLDGMALALGAQLAREEGLSPLAAIGREPVRAQLRKNRALRNHPNLPGGYAVLAPQEGLAQYGIYRHLNREETSHLALLTDGLAAHFQVYGLSASPANFLSLAREEGLAALLSRQRTIEAADPEGVRYLRLKRGDDASGVLLAL